MHAVLFHENVTNAMMHTLCYSSHYDSPVLLQYIFKVFTPEVIDQLLGLFEILSTIKPVFDFVQRGGADR